MLSVPVSVISEPSVLTLVQESPSIVTVTTLPPPSVSTTPSVPQQTTTPIPTPPITIDAPVITTAISESNALFTVQLRVAKLKKDVFELKKIDLFTEALAALKTQVPSVVDNYLGSKVGDVFQKELKKRTTDLIQKYYLQQIPELSKKQTPTDENAMDKGVGDTVQDHKRKHDDDENDDDEDPPAGPNQGKKTNRRRTKELEYSKKPSTTKKTPKGKVLSKGSKTGKSASEKEPVEEHIAEVVMDDSGDDVVNNDDQPQDAYEPKTSKTPNPEWFMQPPRHPTPDLQWNKCQVILDQPEPPWFNQMVSDTKDRLTFDDLMATPIDFSKLDWNNPEGDHYPFNLYKPLPLQGHPGHLTVAADYFFNNDLDYLKSFDLERTYTTSITKTKAARYEIEWIKDIVPTLWSPTKVGVKKLHVYGHLEEIVVKRADLQFYKFKGMGKEMSKYLSDFQFGVGVSGGAEAILHSVNRVLSEYHNDGSLAMLIVDLSNAFNLVDSSTLLYEQGDPLGPLLFALILHPLLHKIKDSCKLLLHAWYLDDGTIIGDSKEVAKPSCNGMKLREGLLHVDIWKPSSGVKLLRGAVSINTYFISGLDMRRAANAVDLMSLLLQLHHPQSLRRSIENIVVCGGTFFEDIQWRLASLLIRFGGLGLYSEKLVSSYAFVASRAQSWVLQDHILHDSGICGMDDDYVSALACLLDMIPSFDFSSFTNKDTIPSKAQQTLSNVLFSEMVKDMEVHFDMTMRQEAVFECLCAPHAQDFLLAIPIDGLGQHMSLVEYRTILKYLLMIPLFLVDAICPVCHKACLDSFGEHAVHCKELPRFKYRHDMIRDVLFDICRCVEISFKKEEPMNFLTDPSDGRSTLRPADVLVFGWVGGKHACVDLIRVSPLMGLSSRGFTAGQAALRAASCKVTKHEKACIKNQHVFIPFAFYTFGFLAPEALELLSRVQRVMHNNVMTPRSTDVVFKLLFKKEEGDFVDLHLNDIEDMLLLAVQHKLFHLTDNDIVDFIVALCMFTRIIVIKKRVEILQLGVESYQKKLNITPPQQTFPEIEFKELYTPSHKPPG
ncbi:hypothetical protein Tco_0897124, partial [Tanacetum coccineum]